MQLARCVPLAVAAQVVEFSHLARHDVAGGADHARTAQREHREAQQLNAAVDMERSIQLPRAVEDARDVFEILVGLLDADDVGAVTRQSHERVWLQIGGGAAGNVIEHNRQAGGFRERAEVPIEPGLARAHVIGDDQHDGVGAGPLAVRGQRQRLGVVDRAGPGQHRDATVGGRDGDLDDARALLEAERAGFAGRAGDDDAMRAAGHMPVDQLAQRRFVELVVAEGCHQWNQRTVEHRHPPSFAAPRRMHGVARDAPVAHPL